MIKHTTFVKESLYSNIKKKIIRIAGTSLEPKYSFFYKKRRWTSLGLDNQQLSIFRRTMAGKCKIYSKDYILSILKNKFTIKNLKEEYTTKDKLELICNDCDIECTKNIGNKFNGECRNCNMKKSHYNKIDSEVKMYPEIISWKEE